MIKRILLAAAFMSCSLSNTIYAQNVGINIDNSNPDASAMLDVKSINKGILIPRMTTAQRNAIPAPATGLMVFDNTSNTFWYFNGAVWIQILAGTDSDNQDLSLTGNILSLTNDGTAVNLSTFLDNTDNQTLTYVGTTLSISGGNSVNIPNGDVTGVTAGTGLTGGGATGNITINAVGDNGLTTNANDIDLGGALNQLTTITQGANNMVFNLDGAGDFHIQDNGTNQFSVLDNGDIQADNTTFYVDASTNRVGIGTTAPGDALHVVGDVLLTGGVRNIEIQAGDQNIQLDDANPVWNGLGYGGVTRFFGDGTLASSKLEAGGLQLERHIQIRGGNPALNRVLTSDAAGNGTWQDAAGLVTVNNGLNFDATAGMIQLGGNLVENTAVNAAAFALDFNLNGTGDFTVQDNGTDIFQIRDDGIGFHGNDFYFRDGSITGTNLVSITDDANDGRLLVYENGITSVDLDANTQFIFNEQGLDRNFRVESNTNANMLFVDAGLNRVGIGTGAPTEELHVQGGGRVTTGLTIGTTPTYGTHLLMLGSTTTPAMKIGFTGGFNNAESGRFVFDEYADNYTAPGTYCGFEWHHDGAANNLYLNSGCTGAVNRVTFERNGDVGIGTTAPTALLSVNGTANKTGGGTWAVFSDARLKKNVTDYKEGLDLIMKVRTVNFSYNNKMDEIWGLNEKTKDKVYQGVIAQELQKIAPDMVREVSLTENYEGENDKATTTPAEAYLEVDPNKFTYALINAVQEQQAEISELKAENEAIKAKQDAMEKEMAEIKAILKNLQK